MDYRIFLLTRADKPTSIDLADVTLVSIAEEGVEFYQAYQSDRTPSLVVSPSAFLYAVRIDADDSAP